ncbi:MAG: SEC-C domain-containing protein, partial [Clostridia bacterium]|nr:SEC-C domain-containing protein [Clostridia bacterium]
EKIRKMVNSTVSDTLRRCRNEEGGFDFDEAKTQLGWLIAEEDTETDMNELETVLLERINSIYENQETLFGEGMRELERVALLRAVDTNWIVHLDEMDDLRDGVGLNAYAQRNPLTEYRIQSGDMFDDMIEKIRLDTVRMVLFAKPAAEIRRTQVAKQKTASLAGVGGDTSEAKKPVVRRASERVGRNDPCPCGSGKKYKQCCGKPGSAEQEN